MNPVVIIFPAFALFVLIAWAVGTYNKFVKYRNRIEEAWSGIDVALKRRANMIPNLVRVIEGYGAHEAKIFQEKTRALVGEGERPPERMEEESRISKSLGGFAGPGGGLSRAEIQ